MGNSPNWSYGYVPTQGEINQEFATKQDELGLSLASLAALRAGLNTSDGFTGFSSASIIAALDLIGSTQGAILYRGENGWVALPPGTAGQILCSGGAGANPSWQDR